MARIGVTPWRDTDDRPALVELAQRSEELGYDSIWLGESWGYELFTMLTFVALHTSRIKVAAGIVNIYSRTPAVVAMASGTLDDLSDGRLILGVGTSGAIVVQDWHGVAYEKPLQRTREFIEIVRMALRGDRVNYQGQVFRLQNFRMQFTPRRKGVPIYVAAIGPQNLHLTGELADGCIPILPSKKHGRYFRQELAVGAASRGRDAGEMEIAPYIITAVSSDRAEARHLARAHAAYYIGGMGAYYNQLVRRYGYQEEAEAIQRAWLLGERERAINLVNDAMLDDLTLAGTPSECREMLEAYEAVGFTLPVLTFAHGSSKEMVASGLEALAPQR
ncbi:MAG: LLM class flavin-dependent oxidoreductase [Chloroflexi bacterium]|nr:LLM class flavin-dependent oxidoreductase [Chloroflexota bacterium]